MAKVFAGIDFDDSGEIDKVPMHGSSVSLLASNSASKAAERYPVIVPLCLSGRAAGRLCQASLAPLGDGQANLNSQN